MDKALRNIIYNTVVKCRELLERDLALQLEGIYGIHADGTVEPLDGLTHLDAVGRADREAIGAFIGHKEAAGADRPEAVEHDVRESAFTFLNRLAALKLMEHPSRALIQPSVGAGDRSKGFTQFSLLSPEAMRAQPDGGYQLYLELLFDDLGQTLGVLFDRTLPTSLLFPSQPCLQQVLTLLNDPALETAWAEDETIGWIYQYFTPAELREQARKASGAPRNSYELAFRNQFYTPRYVVAFLADNTLGRLWWEMRGGETALAEQCRYLVKRKDS
ncbi:MAG: SAM-dependent methyltransferase, partial [Chloroflexi bacterium]